MAEGSRTFKPRKTRIPVRIPVNQSTIELFTGSEIMNLSKGGLFIRSDISLPVGSMVDLQFTLPLLKKTIKLEGVVVWSRHRTSKTTGAFQSHPPGMGVEFRSAGSKELKWIQEEIERQMRNL